MFTHVFVGADDVAASKKFYDAVRRAIGVPEGKSDPKGAVSIAPRRRLRHRRSRSMAERRHMRMAARSASPATASRR